MTRRGMVTVLAAALMSFGLGGCGLMDMITGKPKDPPPKEVAMKPPPEARLQVTVVASPLVNPDLDGRASPIVVRVYQLASPEAFLEADFTGLYETDEKSLGKSLLGRTEMILEPAGIKAISSALNPEAAYIGIVAGYRQFDTSKWRALLPLQGQKRAKLRATLLRSSAELAHDED